MKKYTRGEIAKIILKSIIAGVLFVTVLALPGLAQVYTLFQPKNARERYRINRTISNLQKQKFIRIYKKDGKDVVEITKKGKRKVLMYNLADMKISHPKRWDGWWRIVIFDIPENKRDARRAINIKFKEMGLYSLQKSTFVSPYPCKKELDFIGNYFGVRNNIVYIKAKEMEASADIKKYFNL
ncbi:MAG: hypothetical protein HYT28_01170 [Parcubacteria group bacterium]|nr:hypothetical protein [Parcubacteria group bacterium]